MAAEQVTARQSARFRLQTERVGPLPLVNHFIGRLGLEALLERYVPTADRRCQVRHATALAVLLRSIVVEREPIYRQQETVQGYAAKLYGLTAAQRAQLSDDRLGRGLDRLFDADRAGLLTAVVVAVRERFAVDCAELHNDSTSVSFSGQYPAGPGPIRGRRPPWITYGHSKDHRPDLKQLLVTLTTSADGGVPVQFRCGDGNTSDSRTHIETWEALRAVTGRADFLYVADSKLCSRENLDYIHSRGGRLLTVLPRSRLEDRHFRRWLQTHPPPWQLVWDRPNPQRRDGPRDRWSVCVAPMPSREAWPVVWVYSTLLALHQEHSRCDRIAAAIDDLGELQRRLAGPRSRLRTTAELERQIERILVRQQVTRYLKVRRRSRIEHRFVQTRRGRPSASTAYRRLDKRRWELDWHTDEAAIAYDRKSDGMYPLLSNDRSLSPADLLKAHKAQPAIEKRFSQLKSVHHIAPVFLKNPGRVEALFTLYFLALLLQALIERELRRAMRRDNIAELPLYPEDRRCRRPTTEQILRLYAPLERHTLLQRRHPVQTFQPELTPLQQHVLELLNVPLHRFRG